jgi:hypothetical protein
MTVSNSRLYGIEWNGDTWIVTGKDVEGIGGGVI